MIIGGVNITQLPSKPTPQVEELCAKVKAQWEQLTWETVVKLGGV